ncbi:MAG: hypothetical protein ACM31C_25640 [Acidobacteriota bacterium]
MGHHVSDHVVERLHAWGARTIFGCQLTGEAARTAIGSDYRQEIDLHTAAP